MLTTIANLRIAGLVLIPDMDILDINLQIVKDFGNKGGEERLLLT